MFCNYEENDYTEVSFLPTTMRKFSLLLGTLGGAMAGYILSNEKLRKEMAAAPNAEAMAKTLGQHLTKDGKKVAKEVKSFVESDDVQKNLHKAKAFATKKLGVAQKELEKYAKKGMKQATKYAKKGMKEARGMMR